MDFSYTPSDLSYVRRSKLIMCGKVMGIAFKGGIASHSASTLLWHLDDLDVFNLQTLTKSSRMSCLLLCVLEHAPSYGIYLALSAFVWRALPSCNCTYIHTHWRYERLKDKNELSLWTPWNNFLSVSSNTHTHNRNLLGTSAWEPWSQ